MKNKKRQFGGTLIDAIIAICILFMIFGGSYTCMGSRRGKTERQATERMNQFVEQNGLEVIRASCAGDGDGDGYASCSIKTPREIIYLQCPVGWLNTATNCKEVPMPVYN